eukprot:CAMPEP_0179324766 /NCGR_PEP_ID=MMETSP0797-20121207/60486_1 /TAXON_ID=47934 /ORGANISM="Dinophysis acuminata, Strain DAEP01" /LENGTH=52 /DNA_ID=CAMNT_0021036811 /DNA_START=42 /DNA_END=196 /DNA_ORIENTATION=-
MRAQVKRFRYRHGLAQAWLYIATHRERMRGSTRHMLRWRADGAELARRGPRL